jgi:DnaK suppressor protein
MPLKKAEIEHFKKRLLELRAQISNALRETNKEVTQSDQSKGYSQHQADEGTDDFVKSVTLQVSSKEMSLLRQIDRALEKIDEDTYGICDLTGDEIPIKRLEAIPYATMTVKAQDQFEKGLIQ